MRSPVLPAKGTGRKDELGRPDGNDTHLAAQVSEPSTLARQFKPAHEKGSGCHTRS